MKTGRPVLRNCPALLVLIGSTLVGTGTAFARHEVSLDGQWEYVRAATPEFPPPAEGWQEVSVPSALPQMPEPHVWYRRSFRLPKAMRGERTFLRFGAAKFVTQVFVNDQEIGGHYGGWEPFELDASDAILPDQDNRLLVRVTDVRAVIDQEMDWEKQGRGVRFVDQASASILAPVGSRYGEVGLWESVSLISYPDVFIEGVFVKTSVRERQVEADITVRNLSAQPLVSQVSAVVLDDEESVLSLPSLTVDLPAHSARTATTRRPWADPKLWWPHSPQLYHLATEASAAGAPRDQLRTRFGFREFWTDGDRFVLNGTPLHLLATAGHPPAASTKESAKELYSRIRQANCMAMRLHANLWPEHWYEAADEVGMLLVQESAWWCFSPQYALDREAFWQNVRDHLRAMIQRDRNHPSVVMYSLENEILHCRGDWEPTCEKRLGDLGDFVRSLDPTRPIMFDGDEDPDGRADVINLHYPHEFPQWNLYPNTAYWINERTPVSGWPRREWEWDRAKPLYVGEFLHSTFSTPMPYTLFLGDEAFRDYQTSRWAAKATAWRFQVEAFRSAGVSGMCPWTLLESGTFPDIANRPFLAVQRAYDPNAALVKEYDTRFWAREAVARTVWLYNDTLFEAPLELEWELLHDGERVDGDKHAVSLAPADKVAVQPILHMPEVTGRTPLRFALQVRNKGQTVFEDNWNYWVFPEVYPALKAPIPVAVFGQDERLLNALEALGAQVSPAGGLSGPAGGILVVAPRAIARLRSESEVPTVGSSSAPREQLARFVRGGGVAIVLPQTDYAGVVPASLSPRGCTIAFQRIRDEVLFEGIQRGDFRMWRGDHLVASRTVVKPRTGCFRALVDAGGEEGLVSLPLAEIIDGRGRYLLCQMPLIEKWGSEPVARLMLRNLIRYAHGCADQPRRPVAVIQSDLDLVEALRGVSAGAEDLSEGLADAGLARYAALLAETDAPALVAHQAQVRSYVERGGLLWLTAPTPDGLGRLAEVFPRAVTLQRTSAVPVLIEEWDPLINGLTNQELYWLGKHVGRHTTQTPLSRDVLQYAVGSGLPEEGPVHEIEAEAMRVAWGPAQVRQGDVYMGSRAAIDTEIEFPRQATYVFGVYARGTEFEGYPEVTFRVDGERIGAATLDSDERHLSLLSAPLTAGRHVIELSFTNDKWDPVTRGDRNLWIDRFVWAEAPPAPAQALLRPAALAALRLGSGTVILDCVRWHDRTASLDQAARYLCNLLTNLGVEFEAPGGWLVVAGADLDFPEHQRLTRHSASLVRLGSNGYVFSRIRFEQTAEYDFEVQARGTEAAGEYPKVRLDIDENPVSEEMIPAEGWRRLRYRSPVQAGEHEVRLNFTNDFWDPPADRNLDIAELRIRLSD